MSANSSIPTYAKLQHYKGKYLYKSFLKEMYDCEEIRTIKANLQSVKDQLPCFFSRKKKVPPREVNLIIDVLGDFRE